MLVFFEDFIPMWNHVLGTKAPDVVEGDKNAKLIGGLVKRCGYTTSSLLSNYFPENRIAFQSDHRIQSSRAS
jgi:hypothetical protein